MGNTKKISSNEKFHFWGIKIPISYVFLALILAIAATYLYTTSIDTKRTEANSDTPINDSPYLIKRMSGYKFIRPLISAKPIYEYPGYEKIKKSISDLILSYQDKGIVSSVSFYMRDFDQSNWIAINNSERYFLGSIIKIPILMALLKTGEHQPQFLNQGVIYNMKFNFAEEKKQSFISKQIEFGKIYTIRQLLEYMIENSDNNAAQLLWLKTDKEYLRKLFKEFGLPELDLTKSNIAFNVSECSTFLESLVNATYLNKEQSEFAIDLLSRSDFKEGIVKGIPDSKILIAHKFGETGSEKFKELHETAIIYINDHTYLFTIMTRGKQGTDFPKLATVIQEIAHTAYNELNNQKN